MAKATFCTRRAKKRKRARNAKREAGLRPCLPFLIFCPPGHPRKSNSCAGAISSAQQRSKTTSQDDEGSPLKLAYVFYTPNAAGENLQIDSNYMGLTAESGNAYGSEHYPDDASACLSFLVQGVDPPRTTTGSRAPGRESSSLVMVLQRAAGVVPGFLQIGRAHV